MQKSRVLSAVVLLSFLFTLPLLGNSEVRVHRGTRANPLTGPSNASPVAIIAQYLRAQGYDGVTLASIVSVANGKSRQGISQVRFEQRVNGLAVFDSQIRAALSDRGELLHLIENVVRVPSGSIGKARADERQALRAALQRLYPALDVPLTPIGKDGSDTVVFARDPFFYTEPRVRSVVIPTSQGGLTAGFLVETWTDSQNLLHHTLVSGDGAVLSVELRTNTDSYSVFPEDPLKGPQTVVDGPGAGNAESPAGWLFSGAQNSINIEGNNAHAYLDAKVNNRPDRGGTAVTDGNFLALADLSVPPSTANNRDVAVQNLFYQNNIMHDVLYRHGFDEAAGNFQEQNFSAGGVGSDSVLAEAQDGSGTDNANFATPSDGRNPRMQMFLWQPDVTHDVVVGSATYAATGAAFGPSLDSTGITGPLVLVNDGVGTTSDACEALPRGSLSGQLALVDRGTCNFTVKVKNAQGAGAIGTIVMNNQGGDAIFTMGGTDNTIRIPSVMVSQNSGTAIRGSLPAQGTARLKDPLLMIDGDLDADIIYHEYGHGLTWRMIGGMSGPMSGAIGEGMSDAVAFLVNGDDRIAEYSFTNEGGLRRHPYTNYPGTYASMTGAEVHDDGEIYGAIVWRLREEFTLAGVPLDVLWDYIVDGMNFTPSGPAVEDMRDGIVVSATNAGLGHECLVWRSFAAFGVGEGASGTVNASGAIVVTESFTVPATCP